MSERKIKSIISKVDQTSVYDVAVNTPLHKANILSKKLDNKIYIKREDLQPVFSFKLRGAYCKIKQLTKSKNIRLYTAGSGRIK